MKKRRTVLLVILAIVAMVLILLGVLLAAHSAWAPWLILAGLAVVAIAVWVARRVPRREPPAMPVAPAVAPAAPAPDAPARTPFELEAAELERKMDEALAALRSARFPGARAGADAVAALPWYLVIGSPGAGKTSLLAQSGLTFASPLRPAPGSEEFAPAANCDWRLTDEAVLLDTAGRYATQPSPEDSQGWIKLLDLVRAARRERPINGMVIAIALPDLLAGGDEAAQALAQTLRARIDEAMRRLQTQFPVYLVFTHSDAVRGFTEFFGGLGLDERRTPFGATLSVRAAARVAPVRPRFEEEFDLLARAVTAARVPCMVKAVRTEALGEQLFFPNQFHALRARLASFAGALFAPSSYQERPVLRGFYFTSAFQRGAAQDPAVGAELDRAGIRAGEGLAPVVPDGRAGHFIERLFTGIVFPDRMALEDPSERGSLEDALRRKVLIVGSALLLAFTVLLLIFAGMNQALLHDVEERSRAVAAFTRVASPPALADLRVFDDLRGSLAWLDARNTPGWQLLMLGTPRSEPAGDEARRVFLSVLRAKLLAPGGRALVADLDRHAAPLDVGFTEFQNWYRCWRIVQDPAAHLHAGDAPAVAKELARRWQPTVAASPKESSAAERILRRLLETASRYPRLLAELGPSSSDWSKGVDQRARHALQMSWTPSGVYPSLLAAAWFLPSVVVDSVSGRRSQLTGTDVVSPAFTRAGWMIAVHPELERIEALRDDWSLRAAWPRERPPSLRDSLLAIYGHEYSQSWHQFLSGVRVRAPTEDDRGRFLEVAGAKRSPIVKVLAAADRNTRYARREPPPLRGVDAEFSPLHHLFPSLRARLLGLVPFLGLGAKPLERQYLPKVVAIKNGYDRIAAARRPESAAEVRGLRNWSDEVANGLSDVAGVLFLPAQIATKNAHQGKEEDLAQDWQVVYVEYREKIEGRYPIAPKSPRVVALVDFEHFFAPGGTLDAFVKASLSECVTREGQPLPNAPVHVTGELSACLRDAARIREGLFQEGGNKANLRLSLAWSKAVVFPGQKLRTATLETGGQTSSYPTDGTAPKPVFWPGVVPEAGATVRVDLEPPATSEPLASHGAWGLFELADLRHREEEAPGEVILMWRVPCKPMDTFAEWKVVGLPATHPFQKGFFDFRCPPRIVASPG